MQLILIKMLHSVSDYQVRLVNIGIRCIESLFSSIYSHLKIPVS